MVATIAEAAEAAASELRRPDRATATVRLGGSPAGDDTRSSMPRCACRRTSSSSSSSTARGWSRPASSASPRTGRSARRSACRSRACTQPVAHYDRELRERVDRFIDRLTSGRPVWRRNWFVVSDRSSCTCRRCRPALVIPERIARDGIADVDPQRAPDAAPAAATRARSSSRSASSSRHSACSATVRRSRADAAPWTAAGTRRSAATPRPGGSSMR